MQWPPRTFVIINMDSAFPEALEQEPAVRKNAAFTLVELLVVVGIITILAAMISPTLSRARDAGRRGLCASHLKDIGRAVQAYAQENGYAIVPFLSSSAAPYSEPVSTSWHANNSFLGAVGMDDTAFTAYVDASNVAQAVQCLTPASRLFECPSNDDVPDRSVSYSGADPPSGNYWSYGGNCLLSGRYGDGVGTNGAGDKYNINRTSRYQAGHEIVVATEAHRPFLAPTAMSDISAPHNGGGWGNALFLDSHVECITEGDIEDQCTP